MKIILRASNLLLFFMQRTCTFDVPILEMRLNFFLFCHSDQWILTRLHWRTAELDARVARIPDVVLSPHLVKRKISTVKQTNNRLNLNFHLKKKIQKIINMSFKRTRSMQHTAVAKIARRARQGTRVHWNIRGHRPVEVLEGLSLTPSRFLITCTKLNLVCIYIYIKRYI